MFETSEAVLIFDYWKDPLSTGKNKDFPPLLDEINPRKALYILVSHHHKDHFTRRVFLWSQRFKNIQYIISKDVFKAVKYLFSEDGNYKGHKPPRETVHTLDRGESFSDGILKVKAFGSTDIGNSYAIEINGLKIFHAGDLNAWLWIDESTSQEVERARTEYTYIINEIQNEYPFFDLVMFPVDSRLGKEYWWGAKYFVNQINTKLFVPMHFELVLSDKEKEQRRIDAAAFNLFAHINFGAYVQLASTRSQYFSN